MANTVKIGISASDEGFKSTMQQAASSVAGLGSAMGNTSKQFNTVNGALRAARKEAIELTAQWRALDDEAKSSDFGQSLQAQLQSVLQTAGELQDIKGDVANEIKNLASDTTVWDGMAQGIGVVSSSMQGLAGVVGLAGGDVQAFTQALTVMNTVQSVTNTIIGIGNALQSDSALMIMLRAAKTAIMTAASTTNTVAETANTVATTANTAAKGGNAAAMAASTAATGANTAATAAQTVAQLANNAAVLANPYVLAAAAVVALTAAIIAWVSSTDEATESQLANAAAVDALSQAMDTEYKKAADQISAFMQLKQTYDDCGGSVDQIKKKIIQNTEQQKKAQIQVKNLDQATRIFSAQGTQAFIEGANARAMAMAAEAATAAQLALVMKELGAALAKVAAGEEVNISDVEAIAEKAGISAERFKSMARSAGFYEQHNAFSKNDLKLLEGNDPIQAQQELMTKVSEYFMNEGTGKVLQEMAKNWKTQANISLAPYDDVVQSAEEVQAAAKGADAAHKSAAKSATHSAKSQAAAQKATREEIKKTLNTLEGCDAIIQEAERNIKKLDKTASNYAQRKQELEDTILIAKRSKLEFFKDADTLKGLTEYKKLLKDIRDLLPEDSRMIADIDKELEETSKKIQQMYEQKANSMLPEDLEDLQKFYTEMLKGMKSTDAEYTDIVLKLKKVNNELAKIKQTQDDITSGIQQGSKTWYKRIYEEQLNNVNALMNNTPFSETESPDLRRYTGQMLSAYDINMDYFEQALREMYPDPEALENVLNDIRDENGNKPERIEDIEGIWNQTLDDYRDWLTKRIQSMSVEQQAWNLPTIMLDVTFDYKKSENEKIDERLQKIIDARDELKQLMDNQMIAPSSMDTATEALKEYNREINNLKRNKVFNELNDDIQEYSKNVRDGIINAAQTATDNIKTLYNAFTDLPDKLGEAENAFEAFFDVLDTLFSVVNGVISMIDAIKTLSEAFELLSGAQTAQDAMTQRTSALLSEQVVILGSLDAAQTTKMATDQAAIIPEAEKAAAAKATAMMLEQEAAAAMFAAHAEIPFVGAALGAAQVAIMEGVLGGIKATQMLANGGIIQGSTTMGDRILVRANAGEMVLNRKQQANLFKALDEGVGTSQGYTVSNVRIKGSDLYLALKNYSKIKGKSGLTTGIQ